MNKSLKELTLINCEIGTDGGKALAAALSEGTAVLTKLNARCNGLGYEGEKESAATLRDAGSGGT